MVTNYYFGKKLSDKEREKKFNRIYRRQKLMGFLGINNEADIPLELLGIIFPITMVLFLFVVIICHWK